MVESLDLILNASRSSAAIVFTKNKPRSHRVTEVSFVWGPHAAGARGALDISAGAAKRRAQPESERDVSVW